VHLRTLSQLRVLLAPLSDDEGLGRTGRLASELMSRTQAIMEGLDGLGDEASTHDRARAINPTGEVYAGSIRLAPADALPWPFRASKMGAPSVFSPIDLTPVEWRDESGQWVFGWSITG
ncbi:MAG: hypothetical protein GWP91_25650, partial [Rhodobacterales bacterium]|nr:hypothetical protein [Rhodobacterales bacterium]